MSPRWVNGVDLDALANPRSPEGEQEDWESQRDSKANARMMGMRLKLEKRTQALASIKILAKAMTRTPAVANNQRREEIIKLAEEALQ